MKKVIEPTVDATLDTYQTDLINALNWYNREKDKKEGKLFLLSYIGSRFPEKKNLDIDSNLKTTYCWLARLISNNNILSEKHQLDLNNYIDSFAKKVTEVVAVVEERRTVREYTEDKISEYIGSIEGELDDVIVNNREYNLLNDLKAKSIPAVYCNAVTTWIGNKLAEYREVEKSMDDDIKEGYKNFPKRKLNFVLKVLTQWETDINLYFQIKKANRKPRKKKIVPASVQVKNLNFKSEDKDFNLKSVNPTEIVGASQVWIFNTKYKRLSVYRTDSTTGLQVKGSTLQNYDPEMCEQRTVRKPLDVLKKVLAGGKIQLRKIISELTTKEIPVNGRINDECIIVRAIK